MRDIPIHRNKQHTEITFDDLSTFFKSNFRFFIIIIFISGLFGYSVSFLFARTYQAQTVLLPEQGPTSGGGFLASLAGLGGISAMEKIGAVRTDLYPNVMQSIPFALSMLKIPVTDVNGTRYNSLDDYLSSKVKPSFMSSFFGKSKIEQPKPILSAKSSILSLSLLEEQKVKIVLRMVNTNIDQKLGIITIQSESNDPIVSAILAEASTKYLLNYVEDYRTGKTAREVDFLGKRMEEAKQREERAEFALQSYRDRNRNPFLNVARIEEQRMQANYVLAQSLYADLARKFEQARIKVQEEQPIFKVLEPVKVPTTPSKPRRLVMALSYSFIGSIIGLAYVFLKKKR